MPALRKFGTPLHNLPKKTVKSVPTATPTQEKPKSKTVTKQNAAKKEKIIEHVDELIAEIGSLDVQKPAETTEAAPSTTKSMSYDREFLLSFSQIASPIEGLLPEILRGATPAPATPIKPTTPSRAVRKAPQSAKKSAAPSLLESPVKLNNRVKGCATMPAFSRTLPIDRDGASAVARSLDFDGEADAEKKVKKVKAKETDVKRLASRQKQLDIGMNTAGYRAWLEQVPAAKRNTVGPRIPDLFQICSKRSWDGQVRKWRRELHSYDPEGTPMPEEEEEEL